MTKDAIVFACANPVPEIWPWEAQEAGAAVVAAACRHLAPRRRGADGLVGRRDPRAEAAIAHCDRFALDAMPPDAERLLQLLHSLLMVSYAVEVWRQPEVIHCGSARIDRVLEPRP